MTDNEIIKALPKILYGGHGCIKCEYAVKKGDDRCGLKGCKIAQDALDLINRQRVEIERLNTNMDSMVAEHQRLVKQAKSEAIREFAEKLEHKSELMALSVYAEPKRAVFIDDINNLAKERGG